MRSARLGNGFEHVEVRVTRTGGIWNTGAGVGVGLPHRVHTENFGFTVVAVLRVSSVINVTPGSMKAAARAFAAGEQQIGVEAGQWTGLTRARAAESTTARSEMPPTISSFPWRLQASASATIARVRRSARTAGIRARLVSR